MKTANQGKIFLADQRGFTANAKYKRFSTFNYDQYFNEYKTAIGALYLLNDDYLMGDEKISFEVTANSYLILIPITGTLNFLDDSEHPTEIFLEQVMVVYKELGTQITLSNPFKNDQINYLCIGITAPEPLINKPNFYEFDLSLENQLLKINNDELPFKLNIGRFMGRKEANYNLTKVNGNVFSFAISGAFEFEGRLMHEKDGLALFNAEQIELEALSNNALILLLEF